MPKRVLVLEIFIDDDSLDLSLIVFASIERELLSLCRMKSSNWESISNWMILLLLNPVISVPMLSNSNVSGNAQKVIALEFLILIGIYPIKEKTLL
tara:strand:+ start:204 stop:491 length:288 start_codon:yes stop_codon:yes gene_type:complete